MRKLNLIVLLIPIIMIGQNTNKENCLLEKETTPSKINAMKMKEKNVLGDDLKLAGLDPITGFYRDGFCSTGTDDLGIHVVAAKMTTEFLNFSKSKGNDLITPNLKYGFPGLKSGDVWCLCAKRWKDAFKAGVAPPVILGATNIKALEFISLEDLKANTEK